MIGGGVVDMVCTTVFVVEFMAGCGTGDDGKDVDAGSGMKD